MTVQFRVFGKPEPQGSARAFVVQGRPVITSANKGLAQWRRLVADVAQKYAVMHDGPVWVNCEFYLPAPKSLPKKLRGKPHTKRPDLDKLERAVLDALTHIMWPDDSVVYYLWSRKFWESDDDPPGVLITLGDAK